MTEALWEEYEAFAERDLSGIEMLYLFADPVYESLRRQAEIFESILVTWAICADESKVLVHMIVGNQESYDASSSNSCFSRFDTFRYRGCICCR